MLLISIFLKNKAFGPTSCFSSHLKEKVGPTLVTAPETLAFAGEKAKGLLVLFERKVHFRRWCFSQLNWEKQYEKRTQESLGPQFQKFHLYDWFPQLAGPKIGTAGPTKFSLTCGRLGPTLLWFRKNQVIFSKPKQSRAVQINKLIWTSLILWMEALEVCLQTDNAGMNKIQLGQH